VRKNVVKFVKASLRRTWSRSKQRQTALKAAKIAYGKYRCAKCREIFRRKDINVDHIIAVGKFKDFNQYIERLFCDARGLQILCRECHKTKTREDRKKMK
jgi:5-methylcytosine-specific restriction endonuclease McrA